MRIALKLPFLPDYYLFYGTLGAAYLVLGSIFLPEYLALNSSTLLGLALMPYVFRIVQPGFTTRTYLWPALLVLALAFFIPGKSGIYFGFVLAVLFLLQSAFGRLNHLLLYLTFILSPLFQFALVTFGFPIRLWLSQVTGNLLNLAGFKADILGNVVILNGTEFSVDAGCLGLNMLHTSLVLGLFILAYFERSGQKYFSFLQVFSALGLLVGLNIISNLIRIFLLVLFRILPGHFLHDAVGIICLLLYVIIPFYYGGRFLFRYLPAPKNSFPTQTFIPNLNKLNYSLGILLLLGLISRVMILPSDAQAHAALAERPCSLPGYAKSKLASGVIQFRKTDALVYVKPIDGFYRAEHTPLICWIGSGYTLQKIRKKTCAGYTIYTGQLQKNHDLLYTAWWFDNGQSKTIEQTTWRWQVLTGDKGFSLINVSAETEQMLLLETAAILNRNIFR